MSLSLNYVSSEQNNAFSVVTNAMSEIFKYFNKYYRKSYLNSI